MCLQDALRPQINCDAQCANLRAIAFNSHPGCYVDNGFCFLTCGDYWQVLLTIGGELRTLEAMVSVITSLGGLFRLSCVNESLISQRRMIVRRSSVETASSQPLGLQGHLLII